MDNLSANYAAPRINSSIFHLRILTAVCLFAVLAKANIWLDPLANGLIAMGYRVLLIATPLTVFLLGRRSLGFSLAASSAGLLLMPETPVLALAGAVFFAYGISVSGFLIKSEAAQTKKGAAYNKIALNVGSLLAGIILFYPMTDPHQFFYGAAVLMGVGSAFSLFGGMAEATSGPSFKWGSAHPRDWLPWMSAGIVIGIKLFAVFSILPQAILATETTLPSWFGLMLILNSAVVVVMQMPVLRLIERTGRYKLAAVVTVILFGFATMAVPEWYGVTTFLGAVLWLTVLSLVECTLSYLDYLAARHDALFVKELSVGLGAGLAVLIMRYVPEGTNAVATAALGFVCMLVWLLMLRRRLEAS
jgi:hypothetical protein